MAESISARVAWKLKKAIVGKPAKGTSNTGTASFVRTDENGVGWVRLPGADIDTPINGNLVTDMKPGDIVSYRIDGGRLSVMGNATSPSVGGTYVANTVAPVAEKADKAISDALRAHDAAELAENSAVRAQASATSASEYASRALGNLSTVQSVAETLAWITAHGTMTPTTDTAPDPTHVYFVADSSGDYSVGGSTYSVVTEPDASDMATYYELSIDESLNNYVGTHLAITDEGLWVIPVASGGYKVLIATGGGTTYTTAGTHIIDGSGVTVAFFGATTRIGKTDESHMELDYHSMQLVDKEGETYFHVSDLRGTDGYAIIVESFTVQSTRTFVLGLTASEITSVKVDGATVEYTSQTTRTVTYVTLATQPPPGAVVLIEYKTADYRAKAYTIGLRAAGSDIGAFSVAIGLDSTASGRYSHSEGWSTTASNDACHSEGMSTVASGLYSHAEGYASQATGGLLQVGTALFTAPSHAEGYDTTASNGAAHAEGGSTVASGGASHAEGLDTTASGDYSHAEGSFTNAVGNHSHAQNYHTIAGYDIQTAIGKYNDNQSTSAFEIGNGTRDSARSNAFAVDWSGNVEAAGTVSATLQEDVITLDTSAVTVGNVNACWHNGVVCTVSLAYALVSSLGNGSVLTIGNVPSEYRPSHMVFGSTYSNMAAGAGIHGYLSTNGDITIRNLSGAAINTSPNLYISFTFAI